MNHYYKIQKLADFLIDMGLEEEAYELLLIINKKAEAKSISIQDWYNLIEEVDADFVDTAYPIIKKYLSGAAIHLEQAKPLAGASEEDIKTIVDTVPIESLIKSAMKKRNLLKYANTKNGILIETAKFCIEQGIIEPINYKKANWWESAKLVGGGILKYVLPFVSLLFAMINLYYCSVEFSKLMSEIPEAGLEWYEPLMPGKLLKASQEHIEDPIMLQKIVKATKTSKWFVDDFISLVLNSIDAIKDIIFLIATLSTAGIAALGGAWVDGGIGFTLFLVEMSIEGNVLPYYDQGIHLIRNKAADMIKEHHMNEFRSKYNFNSIEPIESIDDSEEY